MLLDSAGFLQILGLDKCRQAVTLKETSLVQVLSHDMIVTSPGLEFLIATDDGALICLRQTNETGLLPRDGVSHVNLFSWPMEVKNMNNFAFALVNTYCMLLINIIVCECVFVFHDHYRKKARPI